MPRGDGTGPMGLGTKFGRGFGNCLNRRNVGRGLGVALGVGLGLGLKRGLRDFKGINFNRGKRYKQGLAFGSTINYLEDDELSLLKVKAENIENSLNLIKDRILELEKD